MDKPTIKILMLKGEKGDAYDDSELRAEIEATLANNAYVQFIGDGELELPVHSINDSVTSNTSTWSSSKIIAEYPVVTYTINNDTITCDKTYNELLEVSTKTPKIIIKNSVENCVAYSLRIENSQMVNGFFISAKNNNGRIVINHKPNDTITFSAISENFQSEINTLNNDVDTIQGNITTLQGNVTTINNNISALTNQALNYNGSSGIMIDTSKYNHLLLFTTSRIALITLAGLSTQAGVGFTCIVGSALTANTVKMGNSLTIAFNEISSFCYMLTQ